MGDGDRLPLTRWGADGVAPSAVLLGLHGFGDYRRAFDLAGPWFAERGVVVLAYDQRGFGETSTRGQWPGAAVLIDDLADAVTVIRGAYPDIPLAVIGESMGGSTALAGIGSGRVTNVDALILAAPGVRVGAPLKQLHDLALRLAILAMPWLAVELRRGGRPWLDPDESKRLAEDPLILRELSVGTYDGLVELAQQASTRPAAELPPTLLLHGDLDTTIPSAASVGLAEMLGDSCTLRLYPERHHLLFHEASAAEVFNDCLEWLDLAQQRTAAAAK